MGELFQREPLFLVGLLVLCGFYFGGMARKIRLPSLIGFMALGVIVGPSLLNLVGEDMTSRLSFITEIALGFVAFSIGAELSLKTLRSLGKGIISIIFAESFVTFFVVTLAVFLVSGSWPVALLFGGVAPASAPAGTVAVIQECKAQGKLTQALYAVVGFDDGLAILIFGFAAALCRVLLMNELQVEGMTNGFWTAMAAPALEVTGSLVAGCIMGFLFGHMMRRLESSRDILTLTIGAVFIAVGVSEYFHFSLILTNMVIGFVFVNTRREALVHRVTAPLQEIMPFLFTLFFCLAGAHLDLAKLPQLGLIGVVYIAARSAGLIGGARLGGMFGQVEPKVKKYIGLGILSQAGVAIGLSLMVQKDLAELGRMPQVADAIDTYESLHPAYDALLVDPIAIGTALITSVTATSIVFEIFGPILTRFALSRAGEIPVAAD